jgi:putative endonuclease
MSGCTRVVQLDRGSGPPRAALGRAGERLALAHLVDVHGFTLVATNLRVAIEDLRGELDIVVRAPGSSTLIVCEVKTRSGHGTGRGSPGGQEVGCGGALAALGPRQRARIRRMTAVLLASGQLRAHGVRFDLITIQVADPRPGAPARLGHLAGAW